jgi:hypothetical protein
MFNTPIAVVIFNRPEQTARVFEVIREVRAARLFVIADGPRASNANDARLCAGAGSLFDAVDWPCQIERHFAPANLGSKRRFVSGFDWLFEQVEEAIILEDDCLPDPSFFRFCAELLERHRDDDRVAMISGTNPVGWGHNAGSSYHFSAFGSHWGWATWRRAWLDYDPEMTAWAHPEKREHVCAQLPDAATRRRFIQLYDRAHSGSVDIWDCQWTLGQLLARRVAAVPAVNLVSNTGFSGAGTHTRAPLAYGSNLVRHSIRFPLTAPAHVEANREYDARYLRWLMGRPDTESVVQAASDLLNAQRPARALLLVEAALRNDVATSAAEKDVLQAHRTRALLHLRNQP